MEVNMRLIRVLAVAVLIGVVSLAGMIAFGTAEAPRPVQSITDPFRNVEFNDLPPVSRYAGRDGTSLSYREYGALESLGSGEKQVAVLIHGSAADSQSMHAMAKMLAQDGVTVFVPDLRGHGANQPRGDVRYLGQLDDDLADFVQKKRPEHPATVWTLVGFSSGGGFALRFDSGPYGTLFDRYLLLSPYLSYNGPTQRPASQPATGETGSARRGNARSWVALYTGRLIALVLLNKLGIHWFDGLPVLAFAVPSGAKSLTPTYSLRMLTNLAPRSDYLADIRNIHKSTAVMVGQDDEFSLPDKFAPVFHSQRQDVAVKILPRLGHLDMITSPVALQAVQDWFKGADSAAP
jgi:pimeloyl-ACP methyl ester carboxylesterase